MSAVNIVVLSGNLTRDPELRQVTEDRAVAKFRLASNRVFSSRGEKREDTTFVDCEIWGKMAETFCKYMKKGRGVLIRGQLRQSDWTDDDGNNRSKHFISVDDFNFIDRNPENNNNNNENNEEESAPEKVAASQGGDELGDIPF